MTQNEVFLELSPGLEASGTARAAMTNQFGGMKAERLVDLRVAVAALVTNSTRTQSTSQIFVHVWEGGDHQMHGEVRDDGSGADSLRRRRGESNGDGLQVLDAVTADWGVSDGMAWFVV
jgi:hypothetical protein